MLKRWILLPESQARRTHSNLTLKDGDLNFCERRMWEREKVEDLCLKVVGSFKSGQRERDRGRRKSENIFTPYLQLTVGAAPRSTPDILGLGISPPKA